MLILFMALGYLLCDTHYIETSWSKRLTHFDRKLMDTFSPQNARGLLINLSAMTIYRPTAGPQGIQAVSDAVCRQAPEFSHLMSFLYY